MTPQELIPLSLAAMLLASSAAVGLGGEGAKSVFARQNLVAWCIVPFDARKRSPEERAKMLVRLGITRLAYDWRQQHVPTFEDEILKMKEHGIDFFAFWGVHDDAFRLFAKHGISPQIWQTLGGAGEGTQEEKVERAAKGLLPLVERTRKLGCKLGLYNHGGWGGEPDNLVAVCQWLRQHAAADHVGIVYNLHHGHGHISDFPDALARMKPYLLCLNLNGMNTDAKPMILPLGKGQHDKALLRAIQASGYAGPIGILDHRDSVDAEQSLRENLDGLQGLLRDLGDEAALKTYR